MTVKVDEVFANRYRQGIKLYWVEDEEPYREMGITIASKSWNGKIEIEAVNMKNLNSELVKQILCELVDNAKIR